MKKIVFVAIGLFQFGVSAQWIENGNSITTTDNVGIGTTSLSNKLEVNGTIGAQDALVIKQGGGYRIALNGTNDAYINGRNSSFENKFTISANGNSFFNGGNVGIGNASPTNKLEVNGTIGAQDALLIQKGGSYRIALNGTNDAYINGRNSSFENKFTISANGNSFFNGGNVGIGTSTPDSKLAVNGVIHSQEVKVDLVGWPDYVFEGNYDLPTLQEVEAHIKEKGHLINIPSATEVNENGIQLGEMNKLLLEKIEELMLYTINQQKEIDELKKQNIQLQGDIQVLKQK